MKKLNEKLVREISNARGEPEWLLAWRIDAFNKWQKMIEPHWAEIDYAPIDYNSLNYYNERKPIDNSELKSVYEKMGLPKSEQNALLGMATDTVIDSKSVHTSYTDELRKLGIIFLPLSEAVVQYPDLIREYLGSVVPNNDNFLQKKSATIYIDNYTLASLC